MIRKRVAMLLAFFLGMAVLAALHASAQTPSEVLLVLAKSDNTLAIVNPDTLQVLVRLPSGPDPHEVIASDDGKLAYISNYGGSDSNLNTLSVIDLVAQKALPAINLGALHSAHGLAFAGGKLYFTAETNKAIGRYDPAAGLVDWVMGTGQDRTHMVDVAGSLDRIITSNVSSGTISIIEQVGPPNNGFGPPPGGPQGAGRPPGGPQPGGPRKTWRVTNIRAGNGVEGFDISPDGKEIWAANARDATVSIIDAADKRVTQTIPVSVSGANRLKFTPDGSMVFVTGLGSGPASAGSNLVVLKSATRKEIKRFDLGGGAAGILMAPHGSRAYIAVSGKDYVAVVDLKTLQVTGRISAGKQPDGLAWAERK